MQEPNLKNPHKPLYPMEITQREKEIIILISKTTEIEKKLLELLGEGFSAKEIAHMTNTSQRTVVKRIGNLRLKLKCKNTNQLIHLATKHQLI
jgi:DNA-binding NarL/FixJ family response regulator